MIQQVMQNSKQIIPAKIAFGLEHESGDRSYGGGGGIASEVHWLCSGSGRDGTIILFKFVTQSQENILIFAGLLCYEIETFNNKFVVDFIFIGCRFYPTGDVM